MWTTSNNLPYYYGLKCLDMNCLQNYSYWSYLTPSIVNLKIVFFSASSWFCQCFCLLTPFIETPITQAIFISQTCSTCQKIPLSSYFVMLHRSVTWQLTKLRLFQWRVPADGCCFSIAKAILKLTIPQLYLVSWSITRCHFLKS